MTESSERTVKSRTLALLAAVLLAAVPLAMAAQTPEEPSGLKPIKIRPKPLRPAPHDDGGDAAGVRLIQPDAALLDTPTAAVLDYGGYSAQTRFFSKGGLLQRVDFGVYPKLNLGAALNIDGIIGNERSVRVRAPNVQVKYRFYEGDRYIPAFAAGYDGQGYIYSATEKRYHHRQRGFYVVGTQELGLPGLQAHPSFNISDFDSNYVCGAIPLSYNIRDKVSVMFEWDNINNFGNSRVNSGLRAYLTPNFHLDFGVRGIGQGGWFADGDRRGPERVVQLRYSGNF